MRKLRANKILLLCALAFALCGCKATHTVTEVPVVVEHTSVQHRTDIVRDTLLMRDSVYHYVQGDTVRVERWHYTQGVNNVFRTDTLHIYDSVPYPVETVREKVVTKIEQVPRPLAWWQKTLMVAGGLALLCLMLTAYRTQKMNRK